MIQYLQSLHRATRGRTRLPSTPPSSPLLPRRTTPAGHASSAIPATSVRRDQQQCEPFLPGSRLSLPFPCFQCAVQQIDIAGRLVQRTLHSKDPLLLAPSTDAPCSNKQRPPNMLNAVNAAAMSKRCASRWYQSASLSPFFVFVIQGVLCLKHRLSIPCGRRVQKPNAQRRQALCLCLTLSAQHY